MRATMSRLATWFSRPAYGLIYTAPFKDIDFATELFMQYQCKLMHLCNRDEETLQASIHQARHPYQVSLR